jgi:hypothetical protein
MFSTPNLTFVREEASVYLIILPISFFVRDEPNFGQFFKTFFFRADASENYPDW